MPQKASVVFRTYLLPIEAAVSLFPLVTALIMAPVAVRGYRRRGRAGGWPVLVFYSFVFYLIAALLQTVMPLPVDTDGFCSTARYAEHPQLEPFAFYTSISLASGGDWSPATLLTLVPTWTSLLNAVLLLPLGVYLRYHLRQGLLSTGVLAFATSLFFETTQYTGLWFVYACPYRQFNVDDLILNTGGAVVGWLLAGPLVRVLPVNDPERERARYGLRVTFPRRAMAFLADLAGWLVTWTLAAGLLAVATDPATGRAYAFAIGTGLGLFWFWLVPLAFASTLGKRAVLLRVARPDGTRPGALRVTVRTWCLHAPLALAWLALAERTGALDTPEPAGALLPYVAAVSAVVVWGWSSLAVLLRRDGRAPYERWSGTVNIAIPSRGDRRPAADRDRERDPADSTAG
ncbi:VanZ family protein [Streptomyces sp. JJ38]|uniref:VanZ family protein n=1 Tax=Streptomyces sp. JJ38 TaxID=2738128 RepID=UPI0027DFB9FB|nr:VanZ family protein [Streptomyces sp. JJ38]